MLAPGAPAFATVGCMRPMSSQRLRALAVAAALATAVLGGAPSTTSGLLLAPAILLFAVLLLGFAPGARLLERMRARRFTRRRQRAPRTLRARSIVGVRRMLAPATSALAMRPPPRGIAAIG